MAKKIKKKNTDSNTEKTKQVKTNKSLNTSETLKSNATVQNQSVLDNLILADGKTNTDPDIERVKELEEILGIKKLNPFGTSNLEVFKERLDDMTVIDMQHMCEKIGIFASGSRFDLKEKLLRQFKQHCRGSISMTVQNPAFNINPDNPEHKNLMKLLKDL